MCVKQINIFISERRQITTTQKSKEENKKAFIYVERKQSRAAESRTAWDLISAWPLARFFFFSLNNLGQLNLVWASSYVIQRYNNSIYLKELFWGWTSKYM